MNNLRTRYPRRRERWVKRSYPSYYIYDSNISNVNQNITNFGYMRDVYQFSIVNQAGRRR